jgi:hypothetical protein
MMRLVTEGQGAPRRVTAGSHIPGTGRCLEDTKGHKGRDM